MSRATKKRKDEVFSTDLLSHIFNSALPNEYKTSIAHYLQNLTESPHFNIVGTYRIELDEIKTRCKKIIDDSPNNSVVTIKEIYRWLTQNNLLRTYHAAAFVCCDLQSISYREFRFNYYKTLVLCSTLRLASVGRNDSCINKVFNELRQLALGKREDTAKVLPDPNDHQLEELIERFDALRKEDSINDAIRNSLDGYYVALHNAYISKEGLKRRSSSRSRNPYQISLEPDVDANESFKDVNVYRVKELLKKKNEKYESWEYEENATTPEDITTHSVVQLNQQQARELKENQVLGKQITLSIQTRNHYLLCDFRIMTRHEIKTLCTEALVKQEPTISPVVLLSLLTGRSPALINEQLKEKSSIFTQHPSDIKLTIKHKVATYYQEKEVLHLTRKVNAEVDIFLPNLLPTRPLSEFALSEDEIRSALSRINAKNSTRITLSAICNQIYAFQKQHNLDSVYADLISGPDNLIHSGIPYSHVTQHQLQSFVNDYCRYLYNITNNEVFLPRSARDRKNVVQEIAVGSPLYVQHREIISANDKHITHLNALRRKGTLAIIEFHNSYVLYIYRMLSLSSGYRPVVGTGGRLSDICLETGRYWISDKERRVGIAARMIVLPQLMIKQVSAYKEHLLTLQFYTNSLHPEVLTRICQIIDGSDDFLFIFSNDIAVSVSPSSIRPYVNEQFPLAPNWNRHFLRSHLMRNEKISPALIDCFMGHEESGQEGFNRFSSFSHADFNNLAVELEDMLKSLHFEVVQGCSIR